VKRSSDYHLDDTVFRVEYGDLAAATADAVVSSDDNLLSMGGGVSMALLRAGGPEIARDAQKHTPLKIGDVAVTSAGRLKARFLFHAVTIDYANLLFPSDDSIRAATAECLRLADALHVRRLAFPALGTGEGRHPFQQVAETMTRTIANYILGSDTRLEQVSIMLYARELVTESDLNLFFERAVGVASVLAQGERLKTQIAELSKSVARFGDPGLLQQVRTLKSDIARAQRAAATTAPRFGASAAEPSLDGLANVSQRAAALEDTGPASAPMSDRQLEAALARTKLQGLLSQLNIMQMNLNRYEIDRAKYGGVGVPASLANAIDDLTTEMQSLETAVAVTRRKLVELSI
jgi:O-acetyl-ADP-ribose deacetylase (regulator of RNase III)